MSETRKVLPDLCSARCKRERSPCRFAREPFASAGSFTAVSAVWLPGVMTSACLLKYAGDDLIQRWILHAHIDDRVTIENGAEHLAHAAALDLEIDYRSFAARQFTKPSQVVRHAVAVKMQL